jgi:hypothetical protein
LAAGALPDRPGTRLKNLSATKRIRLSWALPQMPQFA